MDSRSCTHALIMFRTKKWFHLNIMVIMIIMSIHEQCPWQFGPLSVSSRVSLARCWSMPKGFCLMQFMWHVPPDRRYKNIDVENSGWISYEELAEWLGWSFGPHPRLWLWVCIRVSSGLRILFLPEFNLLFIFDAFSQQNVPCRCGPWGPWGVFQVWWCNWGLDWWPRTSGHGLHYGSNLEFGRCFDLADELDCIIFTYSYCVPTCKTHLLEWEEPRRVWNFDR